MASALDDYFEALERLKKNQPIRVSKGTKITNDAVALEAGRGKGSIKKSRPVFSDIIDAIVNAAEIQSKSADDIKGKLDRTKGNVEKYRKLYEEALARELSLIHEVHELRKELLKLKSAKVQPIRD